VLILISWWIVCHISLRSPTPSLILQAGLLQSPEKSFFLPVYAEALARASLRNGPFRAPRPYHGVDPRVRNLFDLEATVDTSFSLDRSDSGCSSSSRPGDIIGDRSGDSMSS
jgi:hypothetical protein